MYVFTGDELISADELSAFLRKLPVKKGSSDSQLSNQEIKTVMRCLDQDGDGELNLKELNAAMRAAKRLAKLRQRR